MNQEIFQTLLLYKISTKYYLLQKNLCT